MDTLRAMPVLEVADVEASAAFYKRLGFALNGAWGEPPGFAIVQRGGVTFGLARTCRKAPSPDPENLAAYVYVSDVKALHAEFERDGLPVSALMQQDYGCDDFDLRDPDGHLIAFGEDRDPNHRPGLGPDAGRG